GLTGAAGRVGGASSVSVWPLHCRYPTRPMTVHDAAIPTRRGVHPQSATSPPQLEGETDWDEIARTRRAAQIRSRHAPGVCSGSFSTGPVPLALRERLRLWVLAAIHVGTRHKASWTVLDGDNILRSENRSR